MIRPTLCILFVLAATAASARPSTLSMTCREAQSIVASKGAVVMSTGPHTYARFVAIVGYCMTAEWGYPATAPTKDTPSCQLGYTCSTVPRGSD
jgi:hypothetical protein